MSITVISSPPALVLAKNQVLYKLLSNSYLENTGDTAQFTLTFDASPANNDFIEFQYSLTALPIRFTFKSGSGLGDNEIPIQSTLTSQQWAALIVTYFKKNYYILRDFDVTITSDAFPVVIKFNAQNYGLLSPVELDKTGTLVMAVNGNGADIVLKTNYGLIIQILNSSNEILSELSYTSDNSGNIYANISELVAPELNSYLLNFGNDFMRIRSEMTSYFGVRAFEQYGFPTIVSNVTEIGKLWALNGGLGKQAEAWHNNHTSFWNYIQIKKHFLSYHPLKKTIQSNQPERLYYLNFSNTSQLNLKVKAYYTGGQTETVTKTTINSPTQYKVYEINLRPDKLLDGFTVYANSNIYKFEVWLTNHTSAVVSEVRTYNISDQLYSNIRYFIFKNSLGAFECLSCTGNFEKLIDNTDTMATKPLVSDFNEDDFEILSVRNTEVQRYSANTGFLADHCPEDPKQAMEWLREFFLSEEKYWFMDGIYTPIEIIHGSWKVYGDNEYTWNVGFEFIKTWEDTLYSPITEQGNVISDVVFSTGFSTGFVTILTVANPAVITISNPIVNQDL